MRDVLTEIWESIRRNKLRTALTGFAVSWGIFMLIVLLGAGNGLMNAFMRGGEDISTNTMQVGGGRTSKPYDGLKEGRWIDLDERDVQLTGSEVFADHIDQVISSVSTSATVSYGKKHFSGSIEGNFPNFRQLLPTTRNSVVRLDAQQLAQALRRVSVIAQSNPSVRFDADADGGVLRLSASSPDQGEASELLGVEVEGESMSIALNFHYVLDCVSAVSGDADVELELLSSMQPAIFKSYASINYLYLLMPVRM